LSAVLIGCGLGPESSGTGRTVAAARDEASQQDPRTADPIAPPSCVDRIADISPREPAAELVSYRESTARILLTTKIVPVIYLAAPATSDREEAREIAAELGAARWPERALRRLVRRHRDDRPLLRDALLRQGYLFESRPGIARALVSVLRLADLFDEPQIFLHRAGRVSALEREGKEYYDAQGERATLLLNDRVAVDREQLAQPLHVDLDEVRRLTGAQRVLPLVIGADRVAVRLVLPDGQEAAAVVESDFPRTVISCTDREPSEMESATASAERFWHWNRELLRTVEAMVTERPAFDEPLDEVEGEQEDGQLRQEWLRAYFRGRWKFSFREEKYRVFDYRGNPIPPQVCIDFVFDTLERASGTWYRKRGRRPGREVGFLDFSTMEGLLRRQTPSVLEFAELSETPFSRYDIPRSERVPFRRRGEFAATLARHADQLREGDMLVIHGLREEDLERHYHTVLVLRTDPLTGVPMVVADNAGRPRIRSLAAVMRAAPRRSIKHRIRVDFEWIDSQRRRFENENPGAVQQAQKEGETRL
jgi:hypothetical protein